MNAQNATAPTTHVPAMAKDFQLVFLLAKTSVNSMCAMSFVGAKDRDDDCR